MRRRNKVGEATQPSAWCLGGAFGRNPRMSRCSCGQFSGSTVTKRITVSPAFSKSWMAGSALAIHCPSAH